MLIAIDSRRANHATTEILVEQMAMAGGPDVIPLALASLPRSNKLEDRQRSFRTQ